MRKKFNILPLIQNGKRIVPFKFILHYRYFNPSDSKNSIVHIFGSTEHGPVKNICNGKVLEKCISCDTPTHTTEWFTTELFVVTDEVLTGVWLEIDNFEEIQLKYIGFTAKESSLGIGETVESGECYSDYVNEDTVEDNRADGLMINVLYSYNERHERATPKYINTLFADYITGMRAKPYTINVLYYVNNTRRADPLFVNTLYSYNKIYDRAMPKYINTLFSEFKINRAMAEKINTLFGNRQYSRPNPECINTIFSYVFNTRADAEMINTLYSAVVENTRAIPENVNTLYSVNSGITRAVASRINTLYSVSNVVTRAIASRVNTLYSAKESATRAVASKVNTLYSVKNSNTRAIPSKVNTLYMSIINRFFVMTKGGITVQGVNISLSSEMSARISYNGTDSIAIIFKCKNNYPVNSYVGVSFYASSNGTSNETISKLLLTSTTDFNFNGDLSNVNESQIKIPTGMSSTNEIFLLRNSSTSLNTYVAFVVTGPFDINLTMTKDV